MADFDWGSLVSQGLQAATGYVQQQMQMKQAKKLAKIQASGGGGGFPMLGTGNMSFGFSGAPLGAGGYVPPGGMSFGTNVLSPIASPNPFGDIGASLGISSPTGASCSLFHPRNTSGISADSLVMQPHPVTGALHFWRHVGTPVEFSRDRAICKAYLKRHGGALRRRASRFR